MHTSNSNQKKPEPVQASKSESDSSYDEKYDALQEELNELKRRMEEEKTQKQNQPQSQNKYADVIEKCRPSVVLIKTIAGQNTGSGSGFQRSSR